MRQPGGIRGHLKTNNYLTDILQARVFRQLRNEHFGQLKSRPASTTVVVK